MGKNKNLFFESEFTRKERRVHNTLIAVIIIVGVIILAILYCAMQGNSKKYDRNTYVDELEIIHKVFKEEDDQLLMFNGEAYWYLPTTNTKYYFTLEYNNSVNGTIELEVSEEVYGWYEEGDFVKANVSELYDTSNEEKNLVEIQLTIFGNTIIIK